MSSYTKPIISAFYETTNFFKKNNVLTKSIADIRYLMKNSKNINQTFTRKVTVEELEVSTITYIYNSLPIMRNSNLGYIERVSGNSGTLTTANQIILSIPVVKKGVYIAYGFIQMSAGSISQKIDVDIYITGVSIGTGDNFGILLNSQSSEYPSATSEKSIDSQSFYRCDSTTQIINLRAKCNPNTINFVSSGIQIIRIA